MKDKTHESEYTALYNSWRNYLSAFDEHFGIRISRITRVTKFNALPRPSVQNLTRLLCEQISLRLLSFPARIRTDNRHHNSTSTTFMLAI